MSLSGERLARAEERATIAHSRLRETMLELKARLAPRRLLQDAMNEARQAGESMAESGMDAAKRHPIALVSFIAGLAAVVIRRKRRKHSDPDETEDGAPRLKAERAKPRRTRKAA